MIKNYFIVAWRQITRHKIYAVINVLGLALGVCACLIIYLVTSYEFSFDTFHKDNDRIYRIMGDVTENNGEKSHLAKLPVALSQTARTELPGVDLVAGISPYNAKVSVPDANRPVKHFDGKVEGTNYPATVITEPQYFEIFNYQWLAGNAVAALNEPFRVVLTESKAHRYFGPGTADQFIGREVIYNDSLSVRVSGIVKDWTQNTDLAYTDFISSTTIQNSFLKNEFVKNSWGGGDMNTWAFIKLPVQVNSKQMNARLAAFLKSIRMQK